MHPHVAELLDLLRLERIDRHLYRGECTPFAGGHVFGGLVIGQALSAAQNSVPDGRAVHSLHAYFLRPGKGGHPIVYTVDPIRDGRSFTTRRVT